MAGKTGTAYSEDFGLELAQRQLFKQVMLTAM